MDNNNYSTTHKGIAAYLISQGHKISELVPGINPKNGRPNVKIIFECDHGTGRALGDAMFDGKVEGNLKEFYDACNEVGRQIWEAKGGAR